VTVRAVVFDYFGTLTPTVLTLSTVEEQRALAGPLGVDPDEFEQAWHTSFAERSTGRTGDLAATIRLLAERLGAHPTDEGIADAILVRSAAYRRSATPRPEAVEVLRAVRDRGLKVGVVSDCSDELVVLWPELPIAEFVDATVFSSVVGRRKPDPVMYRLACERLGVDASSCLYVGDGGSGELTGAVSAGMRAVLLADADWANGHRYDADDWSGESVHHLRDVPNLVRQPESGPTQMD
jgi:putative hydrolase of the HAD superfamily